MMEKIMKAVKSNNKKRGRNITMGAVVGMLLSCTTMMGADESLYIKENNSGKIEFSTKDADYKAENPYSENSWDEPSMTYTNNRTLSGKYGISTEFNLNKISLTNTGKITGSENGLYSNGEITNLINTGEISADGNKAYAIFVYQIQNLINTGKISAIGDEVSAGIYTFGGISTKLINIGEISINNKGKSGDSFGVEGIIMEFINNGKISSLGGKTNKAMNIEGPKLLNTGEISSSNAEELSFGIQNNNGAVITNTGKINADSGSNTSVGIYGMSNILNAGSISAGYGSNYGDGISGYMRGNTTSVDNRGIIYGAVTAISISGSSNRGVINNYGILATDGNSAVTGTTDGGINNYGMYITGNTGIITIDAAAQSDTPRDILVDIDFDADYMTTDIIKSLTVRNAKLNGNSGVATSTESFVFSGTSGEYDDSILNGKDNTLAVTGRGNEVTGSVINAYGTAVLMDGKMTTLTLNDTVVNGGLSKDNNITAINMRGEGNTLTVKGNSAINGGETAVTVDGENNVLILEDNTRVNGKMISTGNNTLNFNGTAEYGMNVLHDISGFVNMNIDNNVTFFEDVKITGTKTITVDKTGMLNLRLKKSDVSTYSTVPTAVHALSDRDGTHEMTIKGTSIDEAGTLNFITNGIGREIYVDMRNIKLENMNIKPSSIIDSAEIHEDYIHLGAGSDLSGIVNPKESKYNSLNGIYKSIYSSTDENVDALRDILEMTYLGKNYDFNNGTDEEQLKTLMTYLNGIYTETPYSYSSELSRRSIGMFRDIVAENEFKPNLNQWMIMGGFTHADGGTKDTYYGQNYHGLDIGSSDTKADMKLTGAYMLGKYGYSENVTLGVTAGGNKSEAEMSMSKVKGNSGYLGAFVENYRGNLTLKAGAGIQYSEYDADRTLIGRSYNDKYSDMAYDIYLNGRYSNLIGENLFLEPYAALSYTYIKQDGTDEGNKTLAIETDSKSFDYTVGKVGLDLKKIILHSSGKSILSAGVSYTRILDGADEEYITGRFKGGSDFDILVAHKNKHSLGLNAKYALELENGVLFDVKGTYSVERDSHNGTGKNKNKGEWIVGAGLGYKF